MDGPIPIVQADVAFGGGARGDAVSVGFLAVCEAAPKQEPRGAPVVSRLAV